MTSQTKRKLIVLSLLIVCALCTATQLLAVPWEFYPVGYCDEGDSGWCQVVCWYQCYGHGWTLVGFYCYNNACGCFCDDGT